MVALIGFPMFIPLLRPEQREGIAAIITLRPFPHRCIVVIRMCLSLICTFVLILGFEFYMIICGCTFPVCSYAIRTLIVSMSLGFIGLLASVVSRNTIVGYLAAFCVYCLLQTDVLIGLFSPISSGVNIYQIVFSVGCGLAIIFFDSRCTRRDCYWKKISAAQEIINFVSSLQRELRQRVTTGIMAARKNLIKDGFYVLLVDKKHEIELDGIQYW